MIQKVYVQREVAKFTVNSNLTESVQELTYLKFSVEVPNIHLTLPWRFWVAGQAAICIYAVLSLMSLHFLS